jgi:hypothetical protein
VVLRAEQQADALVPERGQVIERLARSREVVGGDVLALGAIRAVRRAGLTVPGDVSVVGYDDSAWLNCTDPPLTTVRQPIESMGKSAVALLVGQMEATAAQSEELRESGAALPLSRCADVLEACRDLRCVGLGHEGAGPGEPVDVDRVP